jgi:hypothetical protein
MINVKKIYSGCKLQWSGNIVMLNYNNIEKIESIIKYLLYHAENQDDMWAVLYLSNVRNMTF